MMWCHGSSAVAVVCAAWILGAFADSQASGDHRSQPPPSVANVRYRAITFSPEDAVSLHVWPPDIDGERPSWVAVSWTGLPNDCRADAWIGLYLKDDLPTDVAPIKYMFLNVSLASSDQKLALEAGELFWQMLNYRSDVIFHLFSGWDQPRLIASKVLTVQKQAHPTGIRLSLTGRLGEVAVTWTSKPLPKGSTRLDYEVLDGLMGRVLRRGDIEAKGQSYSRDELCGPPATAEGYRDPGTFYTAIVTGLTTGNLVRYRVGSHAAWSRTKTFRSPPSPGPTSAVRILAFGDMGERPDDHSLQASGDQWKQRFFDDGQPGADNTTQALIVDHFRTPADLVFHNGDISYAMGFGTEWESFHAAVEPLSSIVPWMISMGNHERDWHGTGSISDFDDSLGECGVPAIRRFPAAPYISSRLPPNDQPWYSLYLGPVALVVLSTEHPLGPGSAQHGFLSAALRAVDRSITPWVVLAGHRPYHVSSSWQGDHDFAETFRAAVGEYENQADLILGAHHHSYQRSCALRDGRCQEGGTVVINLGMGGAGNNKANATMPALFRYVDDEHYGYCRIMADASSLVVEYIRSDDRQVHDSYVLHKQERETELELFA